MLEGSIHRAFSSPSGPAIREVSISSGCSISDIPSLGVKGYMFFYPYGPPKKYPQRCLQGFGAQAQAGWPLQHEAREV